jgi:large subunit ribosomal protein L6e
MAELPFIAPVEKKDPSRPTWKGIPRLSFVRPFVAAEIDPISQETPPAPERTARASLSVGTVAIILHGEFAGKRGVVVKDLGGGILELAGPAFGKTEIDQDYLIATSVKISVEGSDAAAVQSAASKIPEMLDYLNSVFTLKPGDRPHLMKF